MKATEPRRYAAMRSGCGRCHGNDFVNVYEDVDDTFKLGEDRWQG